jgi:hypothetical protein
MNKSGIGLMALSFIVIASFTPARAQMSNMLNGAMGSGMSSMGGMSLPSVGAASPTNLAGLLQYCVQNNYLGGGSAASAGSVKDSLLSKFTGSTAAPASNAGFTSGINGVLDTGNGQSTTLGGTGIQAQVTQKVCGEVLSHAKSLL